MLSFYVTLIVIYTLYATFGLSFTLWWIWFILAGFPSTVLTIPGSLLALKYKERIRGRLCGVVRNVLAQICYGGLSV
jgi:hypothetical protein